MPRTSTRSSNRPQLTVSSYDRVTSLIMALLVMVGAAVFCMLVIWLSSTMYEHVEPVPIKLENLGGGSLDGVVGESLKLDAPETEEVAEETDLLEPERMEQMKLITAAVASIVADIDNPILSENLEAHGGGSQGTGDTRGFGDGPGDGGSGPAWEMQYDESTLTAYAAQLDYFGIELAVSGGAKNQLEYASGFAGGKPKRRVGTRDEEIAKKRTYFTHRSGTVQRYDQTLLARAGINTNGRIILQYYPKSAEDQLLLLQQKFRGLDQQDILKTVFGIRRSGNASVMFVVEQVRR